MVVILKNIKPYLLTGSLIATTVIFSMIGNDWKHLLYEDGSPYSAEVLPINYVMTAIHDGTLMDGIQCTINSTNTLDTYAMETPNTYMENPCIVPDIPATEHINATTQKTIPVTDSPIYKHCILNLAVHCKDIGGVLEQDFLNMTFLHINQQEIEQLEALPDKFRGSDIFITKTDIDNIKVSFFIKNKPLEFTTVTEDYFADAVFIGDSRTVGISQYANITNATFLCKTSLTIYDYYKNVITYENKKTSIHDVLAKKQFKKVYFMVGINECSYGTNEDYAKTYGDIINDIQMLQPDALIFVQGNLLVTEHKSNAKGGVNNPRIKERNEIIQSFENKRNIFYLDINESPLCKDGALIPEYTWDEVHIKAEYYSIWKDFYLAHGIIL